MYHLKEISIAFQDIRKGHPVYNISYVYYDNIDFNVSTMSILCHNTTIPTDLC